jgi:predicted phosphohydrolase
MKIQIASDLHIEYFYKEEEYKDFIDPKGDILILGGDIGSLYRIRQLTNFITEISSKFSYILYIFGNCEFYLSKKYRSKFAHMEELKSRLYSLKSKISNFYILDRSSVVINNYLFSGCTLWSNLQKPLPHKYKILDMTTSKYLNYHQKDLQFIQNSNKIAIQKNLKHIIITHYLPIFMNVKKDKNDLYMTDLTEILKNLKINKWICGHVHKNFIYNFNDQFEIITNQRGKEGSFCEDYKNDYIIELE